MYQALLAALVSVPKILDALEKLTSLYKSVQDEIATRKFEELKKELRETTKRIENAKTNKERRELVKRLSTAISK